MLSFTRPSIASLIEAGIVVAPGSHERLRNDGEHLSGERDYPMVGGVPILLNDREAVDRYAAQSDKMLAEYREFGAKKSLLAPIKWFTKEDWRNPKATAWMDRLAELPVVIAIGGGPARDRERYLNVNIGPFPNVDIVGDALELPFADASVDGVVIQAVLEHLTDPWAALREISRVLKPAGLCLATTPFLQPYHGYPSHWQNFTQAGHALALEKAGLTIVDQGVAVGPTYAITTLVADYFLNYAPRPLRKLLWRAAILFGSLLRPLDRKLVNHPNAHVLASVTYAVGQKP